MVGLRIGQLVEVRRCLKHKHFSGGTIGLISGIQQHYTYSITQLDNTEVIGFYQCCVVPSEAVIEEAPY